jgi:hypothetical protein
MIAMLSWGLYDSYSMWGGGWRLHSSYVGGGGEGGLCGPVLIQPPLGGLSPAPPMWQFDRQGNNTGSEERE